MTRLSPTLVAACFVITGVGSDPPFESGVIATFVEVTATYRGRTEVLYLPYMEKEQAKPRPGQSCRIAYRVSRLNGMVGGTSAVLERANIIDQISCK